MGGSNGYSEEINATAALPRESSVYREDVGLAHGHQLGEVLATGIEHQVWLRRHDGGGDPKPEYVRDG